MRHPFQAKTSAPVLLGNRLTVDPRTLTPLVLVRIQVPQPSFFFHFQTQKLQSEHSSRRLANLYAMLIVSHLSKRDFIVKLTIGPFDLISSRKDGKGLRRRWQPSLLILHRFRLGNDLGYVTNELCSDLVG